ncbi:MAG: hypothetical protein ACFFB2_09435 [Promethearchaeota archaeon]
MTTPLLHIIAAFVVLVIVNNFFGFKIPLEHLIILSFSALLPDILDKALTGSRFPFHSLLISVVILIIINVSIKYNLNLHTSLAAKYPMISSYLLLISLSFVSHPIMDLEGFVPLFYPIDLNGYKFDFQIVIKQSLLPTITDFHFGIMREPFDFTLTYDHEGSLLTTMDVLFVLLLSLSLIFKGFQKILTFQSKNKLH